MNDFKNTVDVPINAGFMFLNARNSTIDVLGLNNRLLYGGDNHIRTTIYRREL